MPQMQTRELWTAIHRYLGLAAMLFLGIAAFTGCILCFDRALDAMLNADLFKRPEATQAIDPVEAVARLQLRRGDLQILSFPLHVAPDRNIPVSVSALPGASPLGYDQIFLDGTDGHERGMRSTEPGFNRRQFVAAIAEFHYDLLAGKWGRWLMGGIALAWLISNFVGIYLTFPRKAPFLQGWKRMWRFSFKSRFPRLMLDFHRASGLWLLLGVTILAFTSGALNFYDEVYEPAAIRMAPLKRTLFDRPAPYPHGAAPILVFADAVKLAEAQAKASGLAWKPATALYLPTWNLYGVNLTDSGILNYHALGPVYYYFDAANGRFVHEVNPYTDSAGLVMVRMIYPLHSGKVGGTATIALVFLLGLATLEMCVTGGYIWWKKRRSRLAVKAAQKHSGSVKAHG